MKKKLVMTLSRILTVQNHANATLIKEFYEFLRTHQASETMQDNHLKTDSVRQKAG
jgi:hypothetical protein